MIESPAALLTGQSLYVNRAVRACYIRLFFNIAILDGRDNDQQSLQMQTLKGENLARFERNDAIMLRLGSDHRAIALLC